MAKKNKPVSELNEMNQLTGIREKLMQPLHGDRRKNEQHFLFPLIDSEGNTVTSERRSGKKRRKGRRKSDVAGKILNIIN